MYIKGVGHEVGESEEEAEDRVPPVNAKLSEFLSYYLGMWEVRQLKKKTEECVSKFIMCG